MAFTREQEETLKQIISAFKDGKKITELPPIPAGGVDVFNTFVEVASRDGNSRQSSVAALIPYIEDHTSYGIEYDMSDDISPACRRIGNLYLHRVLPIQSRMRGCLLNDDGKVVEYLDEKDWRNNTRDGSRGQVMVEIPMHYRKFETDIRKWRVWLSEQPLPGYHKVPKMYVSAYEATIERSTGKLCSVVNKGEDYRGGDNNAAYDGTRTSHLGCPATNMGLTAFREAARKRKPGTAEWNCYLYEAHKTLYWLFVTEYATLDSQANKEFELTAEGFRRGGLGRGVTNIQSWEEKKDRAPFVTCGSTDMFGNGTGFYLEWHSFSGEIPAEFPIPRYRGVENPFGHLWKWTDGVNIRFTPGTYWPEHPCEAFVCADPARFSDDNLEGYTNVGHADSEGGFCEEVIFGEHGDVVTRSASHASSTTYYCDRHTIYAYPDVVTMGGVLFGGDAGSKEGGGLLASYTLVPFTKGAMNFGTRLCFMPDGEE